MEKYLPATYMSEYCAWVKERFFDLVFVKPVFKKSLFK
jgi:hypothetical protein